jgi:hypothetical protein
VRLGTCPPTISPPMASRRRAPEAVDDARRGARAPAGAEQMLLVLHQDGELALQDVERIGVPLVEMRPRPGPRAVVPRLRDAELLEGGLDHDPAAEHSRVSAQQPQQDADRSRLAGTVRPQEAVHLPAPDRQVETVERPGRSEALDQAGNRDRRPYVLILLGRYRRGPKRLRGPVLVLGKHLRRHNQSPPSEVTASVTRLLHGDIGDGADDSLWLMRRKELGPRRAARRRNVELELADLMADGAQRPRCRVDPTSLRRTSPRLSGWHRHRAASRQEQFTRASHGGAHCRRARGFGTVSDRSGFRASSSDRIDLAMTKRSRTTPRHNLVPTRGPNVEWTRTGRSQRRSAVVGFSPGVARGGRRASPVAKERRERL